MTNESMYKPNSDKAREANTAPASTAPKKIDKVITGGVVTKKKSTLRKLSEVFLPDEMVNIKEDFVTDVVVPALKKGFHEIAQNVIDNIFGGYGSRSGGTKISYDSCYRGNNPNTSPGVRRASSNFEYDDFIFDTRSDAERVLNGMDEIIKNFQLASIGDLYDLAGVSTRNYNLNNYGWTDIRSAQIIRVRDGFMLKMPKAMPID